MNARIMVRATLAVALWCAAGGQTLYAATLVGDAFSSEHTGWVDAFPVPTRLPNWRLNLHSATPTLMNTNNANPPTSGATTNDGTYQPDVLVKEGVLAPSSYELSATMRTNDDDIIGLVWNYQDPDNYFRVGIRQQAAGSFGGTQGLAVQKIVGGTVTQISPNGTGVGAASPITQEMIDGRTPFELKVVVNGQDYEVLFDGAPIVSGNDSDLAADRMIGVQSWAQQADTSTLTPFWGTEVDSITLSDSSGTIHSESFGSTPVKWRNLTMTNAAGRSTPYNTVVGATTTDSTEDVGNFGQDINDPWIYQESNGFEYATADALNVDFVGPAIVIDEPGSDAYSDYAMRVRMGARDNDGFGVLVRVQDDDNFYRINFANEGIGAADPSRAPQGLSVQKVQNGVWTELYRDPQDGTAQFLPPVGEANSFPNTDLPMFDVIVQAVGNRLAIRVIDADDNVYVYPLIYDNSDPLLTGTVGLTTWGNNHTFFMGYGGGDGPFLVEVPEPSSVALALLAGLGLWGLRRWQA